MKEFFEKIKNKFKDIKPFKIVNPHAYWSTLLYVFFVIIIGLIISSFYLLYRIKNQQIIQISPEATEASSLINDKLFKQVNGFFESKLLKTKEIKTGTIKYNDPSSN